jgi:nucleotide-binding universal stress UspA family protein
MALRLKRVLCPVDFSENSDHALLYAVAFAEAYDAQLEVLHVVEPLVYPAYIESPAQAPALIVGPALTTERLKDESLRQLEELIRQNRRLCRFITPRVVVGVPFVEIVRAARQEESDLIVMGTRGRTGLKRMLFGSVAEKVARKAPCPVLIVKRPEREFVIL